MINWNGTDAAAVESGQLASEFADALKAWDSDPSEGNQQRLEHLRIHIEKLASNATPMLEVDSDALAVALADEKKRADTLQDMAAKIGESLDTPGPPGAGLDILDEHDPNPAPLTWFVASGDPAQDGFGWMPDATVSVLSGPGQAGKSRIALQLAVAVAIGADGFILPSGKKRPLVPRAPQVLVEGPVVYAAWETRKLAWQNRLAAVCRDADAWALLNERLRYVNMKPTGGLWGAEHGMHTSTVGFWLPSSLELMRYAAAFKARLLIIDPLAGAFMQNENDRALVRAFLSALDQWCEDNGCAVLIISHPAKHGDDAQSGSSDWRNGVQAVWDMSAARVKERTKSIPAPNGERQLRLDKVNEATDRAPDIYLQWENGRFSEVKPPEGAEERQTVGAQAETASTGKTRRIRTDGKQT